MSRRLLYALAAAVLLAGGVIALAQDAIGIPINPLRLISLVVSGNETVEGDLSVNGTAAVGTRADVALLDAGVAIVGGTLNVGGALDVDGTSQLAAVNASGAVGVGGDLTCGANMNASVVDGGSVWSHGALTVDGTSSLAGVNISGTLGLAGRATFADALWALEVDAGTLNAGSANLTGDITAANATLSTANVNGGAVASFFQSDAGGGGGFLLGADSICIDSGCAQAFYDGADGWTFDGAGVRVTSLQSTGYVFNGNTIAMCANHVGSFCVDDAEGLAISAGDGGTFARISTAAVDADAGVVQITGNSILLPLAHGVKTCSSTNNMEIVAVNIAEFAAPSYWFCEGPTGLWRPHFLSEAVAWRTPDDTASVVNGFELTSARPIGVEGHVISCEGTVWTPGTCTGGCALPTSAILRVHQDLDDGGISNLCDLEIPCTAAAGTHHFAACFGYFRPYGVDGGMDVDMTYEPQADGGTCSKLPVANGRCRSNIGRSTIP